MIPPVKDETLSRESYPYRCGMLPGGCPHLFSGIGAYDGRRFCVFIKPTLVNAMNRNPKCPYKAREVQKSIVLRENDKDW